MEKNSTTFIGMDVHKASIFVAARTGGVWQEWQIPNKATDVAKLIKRLKSFANVRCCYEAGPCGFALMRTLRNAGLHCDVIAPALIPKKPGDRVKTDRRDARKLAELLSAGLLTNVHPPTPAQEAVRDLCRARDDSRQDLMRAHHRLSKFLLRHGRVWDATNWTKAHGEWLKEQKFEHVAEAQTHDAYRQAVCSVQERLDHLDEKIGEIANGDDYFDAVGVLRCFRGIDTLTAMIILSELGDITKFGSAKKLMSFLGITPSEHSSGGPKGRKLGGITKAGNAHVRRVLVEAAWHYRHELKESKTLKRRRHHQPLWAVAIADKCQRRLAKRRRKLTAGKKPINVVNVAVARELTGFIWGALMEQAKKKQATK